MADEGDPLAGFDPDEALDRIRELAKPWTEIAELLELQELVAKLDHWLIVGERLPSEWAHPEPALVAEHFFRKQPRRTSRAERRQ
jgi:hypothetical protein